MLFGTLSAPSPSVNSVMIPDGVISPMAGLRPESVNQRFPFGPITISFGKLPGFRPCVYSVMAPDGVILPMAGVP